MKVSNFNDSFWKTGTGLDLLRWANLSESEIINEHLKDDRLFYEYDHGLDEKAKVWMRNGDFMNIMKSLYSQPYEGKLPDDYIEFKESMEKKPDWLDFDLMNEGCKLLKRTGLIGLLVLRNYSLITGYYYPSLVKPLLVTGSLARGATTRLFNTLTFWIEISRITPDAQESRIASALKIRVIHRAASHTVFKKQPDYDTAKYGFPINFADMVTTSIGFSGFYLYGLQKIGFRYSKREEDGVFHLWKYVTWLLGAPAGIQPNNREEAVSHLYSWTKYQGPPDQDSINLAKGLLEENTPLSILKFDFISRNMSYVHKSISNYIMGDEMQKSLKVPTIPFKFLIPAIVHLFNAFPSNREKRIIGGNWEQENVLEDYKKHIK